MINLVREKNPMPEQDPNVRNKNFLEVAEGYTEEMAVNEAMRCLKCRKKPCMSGCPVWLRFLILSPKLPKANLKRRIRSSVKPAPFRLSAAAYVRRRPSARANVFTA